MSQPTSVLKTPRHAIDCPGGMGCRCGITPATAYRMVRQANVQAAPHGASQVIRTSNGQPLLLVKR